MSIRTTTSYRKLPKVLATQDELYSLIVAVAEGYRAKAFTGRLAQLGVSYLDLADELYTEVLEGRKKPKARRPLVKGKSTNPSVELTLPLDKAVAWGIVKLDLFNKIKTKTREEREQVTLESLGSLQTDELEHE